jgi:hypothetical protein
MLLVGCAAALCFSACDSGRPKRRAKPAEDKAPEKAAHEETPVPAVIDVDPSTLDAKKKEAYDKGYATGLKIAAKYLRDASENGPPPADKLAKLKEEWMQGRDIAIQAALQASHGSQDDPRVLGAYGAKAAFKKKLAEQGAAEK